MYPNTLPQNPEHWSFYFTKLHTCAVHNPAQLLPAPSRACLPTMSICFSTSHKQCLVFTGQLGWSFELHGQRAGNPGRGDDQGRKEQPEGVKQVMAAKVGLKGLLGTHYPLLGRIDQYSMGFPFYRQWEQQRVPSDPKPVAPKGLGHSLMSACELTSVVKLQLEKWGL